MTISVKKKKGLEILHVECDMTIGKAIALKKDLVKLVAKPCEREIDLAEVGEMDTAGIQLLLLAKREAIRQNKPLRLTNHSSAVLGVIDTYNLAAYFGDPIWITGGGKT